MRLSVPLVVLSMTVLLSAGRASAQKGQRQDPCKDPRTQSELTECSAWEFTQADTELNAAYKKIVAYLEEDEHREALRRAQRAWVAFRDADCALAYFENRGGSMYPMVVNGCMTTMTAARTKELRGLFAEAFK